ncbi:MAG: hypothetical protein IRZ03_18900 [Acidobacterium ailaaui]|nr:hypothetical protein [Pseudacidobacterium ailaaui]
MNPKIIPTPGERLFAVGRTGSGKTTAILRIAAALSRKRQVQVLATKDDPGILSLPVPVVSRLAQVSAFKFPEYPVVIYHPSGDEMTVDYLDAWCEWCYERKHTVAVIDELTQVVKSPIAVSPGFLNLYTRGRTQDVTVLAGTQRPRRVPAECFTEAEYIYKFALNDERDRKRVAEFTHPAMENQVRHKHGFHVYSLHAPDKVFYVESIEKLLPAEIAMI